MAPIKMPRHYFSWKRKTALGVHKLKATVPEIKILSATFMLPFILSGAEPSICHVAAKRPSNTVPNPHEESPVVDV